MDRRSNPCTTKVNNVNFMLFTFVARTGAGLAAITKSPLKLQRHQIQLPAPVGTMRNVKQNKKWKEKNKTRANSNNNKNSYNSISNELQNAAKTIECAAKWSKRGARRGGANKLKLNSVVCTVHGEYFCGDYWENQARSQSGNANCANYVGHKALRYLLLYALYLLLL